MHRHHLRQQQDYGMAVFTNTRSSQQRIIENIKAENIKMVERHKTLSDTCKELTEKRSKLVKMIDEKKGQVKVLHQNLAIRKSCLVVFVYALYL